MSELDIWCNLVFMLLGNSGQRLYKTITILDDNVVNPWRSVYLKLKSSDYRVEVPDNYTHAVVCIEDNERMCMFELYTSAHITFSYLLYSN